MTQIGKAYAEAVEYAESARAFERAREIAPYNLDGIDYYSTVLWHLKREVELSHLAREAQALIDVHPHTWCALGNCFSLQREHDSAFAILRESDPVESEVRVWVYSSRARTLCK